MLTTKKLQRVNRIKYLGIIFDNKMNFRDHINYIEKSTRNKYLHQLNRQS
jgi:hypothetical protein